MGLNLTVKLDLLGVVGMVVCKMRPLAEVGSFGLTMKV